MSKYYFCYLEGGGAPRVMHKTFAEAQTEAERLANRSPGNTVHVLGIVESWKAEIPVAKKLQLPSLQELLTDIQHTRPTSLGLTFRYNKKGGGIYNPSCYCLACTETRKEFA